MEIWTRIKEKLPKKTVLKIVLVLFICIFVASAIYIIFVVSEILKQERIAAEVNDLFDAAREEHGLHIPPTEPPAEATTDNSDDEPPEEPVETEWQKERRLLLEAEEHGRVVFSDILEINQDFLGMIEIPGIIERQPFVKCDDNIKYLNTDFEGNRNSNGTIFLNMYNDRLLMDNNSVLFGHFTNTGHMFAKLLEYKHAATFAKSPVITLDGLIGESNWVIFAAHVVEPEPWFMIPYNNKSQYADFLEEILARSLFITDVDVTTEDRVITLSVCDYSYEDMRFVVHARKLRQGEEPPSEVIAEANPNRKGFDIPHQIEIGSVNMSGVGFAISPSDGKNMFYVPVAGRLERYIGDTRLLQGPFRALAHNGISPDSFIAAEIVRILGGDDIGERAAYVAIQNLDGEKGIFVFTSPTSRSYLTGVYGRVTPEGIDARFPAIQDINNVLWLYYSVTEDGTSSLLYRQPVLGGESQLLATTQDAADARPLGLYTVGDQTVVVWHEAVNNRICAARIGIDESFLIAETEAGIRLQTYGGIADGSVKMLVEQNGTIRFSSIDLRGVPTEPPTSSEVPEDPE